jgi:anti-sigma factor RsiW
MRAARLLGDYELVVFLDGETNEDRRWETEEALAGDTDAAALLESWRRTDEALRSAFAHVAAEPVPASLVPTQRASLRCASTAGFQSEEPIRVSDRRSRRSDSRARAHRARTLGVIVLSFGAGALLTGWAAGLIGSLPAELVSRSAPAQASSAASGAGTRLVHHAFEAYRTFATDPLRPVEVADPARFSSWLTSRVEAPVRSPDLSGEGLRLIGARLTPGDGSPAALILFQDAGGERVALFIEKAPAALKGSGRSRSQSLEASWWAQGGAGYAVVDGADPGRIGAIAAAVRAQEANQPLGKQAN